MFFPLQDTAYTPPPVQPLASGEEAASTSKSADHETTIDVDKPSQHWDEVHGKIEVLLNLTRRKTGVQLQWPRVLGLRKPIDLHHQDEDPHHWRHQLGKALESDFAHWAVLVLILVDVIATSVDIVLTLHTKANDVKECRALLEECTQPQPWEPHSMEHEPLFYTSAGILGLLCLNIVLLLVAFGLRFFRHPGYVLDLAIIPTALFLEVFLDSEVLALLIILNLWRLIRVAHGVFTVTDDAIEEEVVHLKRSLAILQRQSKEVKEELDSCKARIDHLEKT